MKSSTFVSSISGIFQNTLVHRAVPVGQIKKKCKKCHDCKNYLVFLLNMTCRVNFEIDLLIYFFSLDLKLNYVGAIKHDLVLVRYNRSSSNTS